MEYTYIRVPPPTNSNFFYVNTMNLRHGTAKLLPRPLKGIKASDEKTGVANTNILYHITMMYTRGKKHEMKNANTINAHSNLLGTRR